MFFSPTCRHINEFYIFYPQGGGRGEEGVRILKLILCESMTGEKQVEQVDVVPLYLEKGCFKELKTHLLSERLS